MLLPPCAAGQDKLRAQIRRLPTGLQEDAAQEAWTAHLDGRDPLQAVWALAKREQVHIERHVQINSDSDGEPIAVDHDGKVHQISAAPRKSDSSVASHSAARRNSPNKAA